ncbi:MAG: diaminopimelate epimerase [Arenicellales bacterium IbO2]|nr:MAG: diaminopimelate epimerase [Arenicellales bacterium IbO2]
MKYAFTKMQALGNDFILLDGVSAEMHVSEKVARKLADRHFGVGCDQILLVERGKSHAENAGEFSLRIFNSDGGEVGQCGNGARCVARFLRESGLAPEKSGEIRLRTCTTTMTLHINEDDTVSVQMGAPEFSAAKIPFAAPAGENAPGAFHKLALGGESVEIAAVSLGNPHAVQLVSDTGAAPVAQHGAALSAHASFPEGVNAGFMQIVARDHIKLRVHERGAGETLGCGSGACAAVAVGVARGELDSHVRVSLPGGDAEVQWDGGEHQIILRGPAHTVFHGSLEISA